MSASEASNRATARVAGAAMLLPTALIVLNEYLLKPAYMVQGDAAATARRILEHPALFRLSFTCDLLYALGLLVLLVALYLLLEPVHRGVALLAALCRLMYAGAWLLASGAKYAALRLLPGAPYVHVFGDAEREALARYQMGAGFEAYYIGLPFFALASTLCCVLFLKSRAVPRALALTGVIASAWGVACAFAYLLVPGFGRMLNPYAYDAQLGVFELVLGLWLLFRGVRPSTVVSPRPAFAGAA